MALGIETNAEQLAKRFRPELVNENLEAFFKAIGERIVNKVKQKITQNFEVRTGRLRQSITFRVAPGPDGLPALTVGSMQSEGEEPVVYARLREFGTAILPEGVLKPKRSKYLAFPYMQSGFKNPLLTGGAGVGGVSMRDFLSGKGQAEFGNEYQGTIALPLDKEAPVKILFAKLGKTAKGRQRYRSFRREGSTEKERTKLIPLFVLAKQVKQRGRPFLYPAVEEAMPQVRRGIALALQKAARGKAW